METLEEIAQEGRDEFLEAGGKVYHYIPALNATDAHIEVLAGLVQRTFDGKLQRHKDKKSSAVCPHQASLSEPM